MRRALIYLADRLTWASLVLAFVLLVAPGARGPIASAFTLSTDTPVIGHWRTPEGSIVGTYTTTLGELNDVGRQVTDHEARLDRIEQELKAGKSAGLSAKQVRDIVRALPKR